MQALPSIEVLRFLNWMNTRGYTELHADIPIDEIFVNLYDHRDYATELAERYLQSQRYLDIESSADVAVEVIDSVLAAIRAKAISEIQHYSSYLDLSEVIYHLEHAFNDIRRIADKSWSVSNHARRYSHNSNFHPLRTAREHHHISAHELVDSVRAYLIHFSDSSITSLISINPNSIAHTTISFLRYIERNAKLRNTSIRNVPSHIWDEMINEYLWYTYSHSYRSEAQRNHVQNLLTQVFINRRYEEYLGNILPNMDFSDVVKRSFNRYVRFKCTILSNGQQIFDFINRNWEELNRYSGEHLDIFYDEKELLNVGYVTADKLNIRSKVSVYPSIYLWEYSLDDGYVIPINDLEEGELLDTFKAIIDRCCKKESLKSIADSVNKLVSQMQTAKAQRRNDEQILTDLLMNACRELQNQRIWYQSGGRSENTRNTFISSLLSQSNFIAKDQTLGGESSTGISIGENDIKIFRNHNEPYAIIEAVNLSAPYGKDWHHKNFREHINRIYKYDTNGLSQNYLLTYVDTPMFDKYWSSVLHEFTVTNKCKFGYAEFIDVSDLPDQSNADLRIGVARYRRNGRIVKLYVIAVLMSDHADIPNPASSQ